MKKFDTIEELREERERVDEQYESGLPSYLQDYFDEQEIKLVNAEFFKNRAITKYSHTPEERRDYVKGVEEEFWKNNTQELIKKNKPIIEEAPLAEERIEDERDLSKEELRVLINLCGKDMYLFAIRYFPHYLKRPSSLLHKFLYRTIQKDLNRDKDQGIKWAIAAPRSNAKSTIISAILPIWCMCYQKKRFIILLSNTASQANDFLADVKRELEHNLKLIRDFPHIIGKGPIWRQDEIVTNNEVKMLALGTGNQVRGRRFGIYRPDLIIGDDMENSDQVRSETEREKIRYTWFDKDVLFAGGEEGSRADFFVVGTILGRDSLLNALLDSNEYPEWHNKRFQSVETFSNSDKWDEWEEKYKNRFDINRKETAKQFFDDNKEEMLNGVNILWPEGDPYYSLMTYKITNPSGFVTEKQNESYDSTKVYVFKKQLHWENFKTNPQIIKSLQRCVFYGSLDPSLGKKSNKGDYSCIMTVGRDPKTGYIYVIDISLKRRSVDDQIDHILEKHKYYKYKTFGVETNAFQFVVAESLRKRSREEGYYVPVEEINQYQDKKLRFEGMVPFLLDGTIVFDKVKDSSNQQYAIGVEQITTFTGEGDTHDDCPDALEMAFSLAHRPRFKMTIKR